MSIFLNTGLSTGGGGGGDPQTAAEVPVDSIPDLPGVTNVQAAIEALAAAVVALQDALPSSVAAGVQEAVDAAALAAAAIVDTHAGDPAAHAPVGALAFYVQPYDDETVARAGGDSAGYAVAWKGAYVEVGEPDHRLAGVDLHINTGTPVE